MPHTKLDQSDTASLKHSSAGWELDRTASVTDLAGDPVARMSAALSAPNIPSLGDEHPALPGLFVSSLLATPAGQNSAAVRITYQSPSRSAPPPVGQPAIIELGATLSETTTAIDASGGPIAATVTVDAHTLSQRAELPKLEPQTTLRYIRLENTNPAPHARTYVGKVNSAPIFDGDPATWLCTAITARSNDAGQTYETRYDFQYRPSGWQPQIIYLDPATNRPHDSASPQTINLYDSADFSDLDL